MREPDYEREGIKLYCGDCVEILPELSGVDAVLTDPPYGIGFSAQPTKWQRRSGKTPASWDDTIATGLSDLLLLGKTQIVWGGNYYPLPPSRCWLSWYKPDAPPSMAHFELAWTNLDKNSRQISQSISATNAERVGHPTQKPLVVMRWCLQMAGNPRSVIDGFMGSGTTGVACVEAGVEFIGIERERTYFEIAVKRIDAALDADRDSLWTAKQLAKETQPELFT